MNSTRDNRRKKLYTAENEAFRGSGFSSPLETISDVEKYLQKIWSSKVLKKKYPRAFAWQPPSVADGRGTTRAMAYGSSRISIPLWARTEWVVIHEVSHIVASREQRYEIAGHGWEFCSIYLQIVRTMLGKQAHDCLKEMMRKHKVKFRQPKPKRVMTPQRLEVLRARMAVARAARNKNPGS